MITKQQIDKARKQLELLELEFKKQNEKPDYSWEGCFSGEGCWISGRSEIDAFDNGFLIISDNKNVFKTEAQAKSALAMAQLSHIIAKANGDWIADFKDENQTKYVIYLVGNNVVKDFFHRHRYFLSFKSAIIRDEVYKQNKQLIHDYLMIP